MILTVSDIHKSFGDTHVLQGINLSLNKGDSLVILGGSGAGKSVLLRSLLGLINPDQGSITWSANQVPGKKPQIGMLFQGSALFDSLPVWENVAFSLIYAQKMNRRKAKDIAANKLESVGLKSSVLNRYPAELSGGMKKRAGLARAIAHDPDVIFFDEPTTGLDPIMADVINDLIASTVKNMGATAISITHDMASMRKIGTHVALLYQGKLIWHGTTPELDTTDNAYVQQFINGIAQGPMTVEHA